MKQAVEELIRGISSGDRRNLSKAITAIESKNTDIEFRLELVERLSKNMGRAKKIAISGPPGVGKSSFINVFGCFLVNQGFKVAVLAIDPSSTIQLGSILGDKTRMHRLISLDDAFVRLSPSSGYLGGVAPRSFEAALLCEEAGFDFVLFETVGVGQSETEAKELADVLVTLLQPSSGDGLQGVKKGIIEVSDILAVSKADSHLLDAAKQTQMEFQQAISLSHVKNKQKKQVLLVSSLDELGCQGLYDSLMSFYLPDQSELLQSRRFGQLKKYIERVAIQFYVDRVEKIPKLKDIFEQVSNGRGFTASECTKALVDSLRVET